LALSNFLVGHGLIVLIWSLGAEDDTVFSCDREISCGPGSRVGDFHLNIAHCLEDELSSRRIVFEDTELPALSDDSAVVFLSSNSPEHLHGRNYPIECCVQHRLQALGGEQVDDKSLAF